jgi:hypothetical protein
MFMLKAPTVYTMSDFIQTIVYMIVDILKNFTHIDPFVFLSFIIVP